MADKNVIIVRIFGGLGNQMFQFAVAKSLAENCGAILKLDINSYKNPVKSETPRQWELGIFQNIGEGFSSRGEVNTIVPQFKNPIARRLYRFVISRIGSLNRNYLLDRSFSFRPIKTRSDKVYIDGYWQSYKYFNTNENLIRRQFNLSYLESELSLQPFITVIKTSCSVSLHVRRGDYISNLNAKRFNGVCNISYYQRAIETIRSIQKDNLHIFVFSDDIEWCKKNLVLTDKHAFVNSNSVAGDLYLMSICKHNIIANSTFSWWGAWLNSNEQKIVVAPKEWHKGHIIGSDDLLPANWIKIGEAVEYLA